MIGDYLVVALVFGIAGSFVFLIHRFWLRDAFKEADQASVPAKEEGTCGVSTTNQLASGASSSQVVGDCPKSRPPRFAVLKPTICNTTNT